MSGDEGGFHFIRSGKVLDIICTFYIEVQILIFPTPFSSLSWNVPAWTYKPIDFGYLSLEDLGFYVQLPYRETKIP